MLLNINIFYTNSPVPYGRFQNIFINKTDGLFDILKFDYDKRKTWMTP